MEVSQYNNLNDIYGNWKVKYKADAKTITAIFFSLLQVQRDFHEII